jgi:hypothetical protein
MERIAKRTVTAFSQATRVETTGDARREGRVQMRAKALPQQ